MRININDRIITNIPNSPFSGVEGIVKVIVGDEYLCDISITQKGINLMVNYPLVVYGCDWDANVPNTCKWFEKEQISKVND